MDNIVEFTGKTKVRIPPNQIIKYADDLKEAVVIGIDADDELYVAGSDASIASTVFLLHKAIYFMINLEE